MIPKGELNCSFPIKLYFERNRTKKRCKMWRMRISEKSQPMLDSTHPLPPNLLQSRPPSPLPSAPLPSPPLPCHRRETQCPPLSGTPPQQLNAPQGNSLLPHSTCPNPHPSLFFFPLPSADFGNSPVSLYRIPLTKINKMLSVRSPFLPSPFHYYFWYNFLCLFCFSSTFLSVAGFFFFLM